MNKLIAFFMTFIIFCTQSCFAQQEQEIVIRIYETVTSETIKPANNIMAELVTDFFANGSHFEKGAQVLLLPKEVKKSGFAGRGGYIEIRKGIIKDSRGKEFTVSLRQKIQGEDKDWVIACMTIFTLTIILIPLDFIGLIKGKPAILEEGTTIEAVINFKKSGLNGFVV